MQTVAHEILSLVASGAAGLTKIDEQTASIRPAPGKWSKKEILGHLVDSASNNHQRFVRAQLSAELTIPDYEQIRWVSSQDYQSRPWGELIDLWVHYNHHLAHVIRRIPDAAAGVPCRLGKNEPITLTALVQHYLGHVRHHLEQIEQRLAS